jgi:fluoride exporter
MLSSCVGARPRRRPAFNRSKPPELQIRPVRRISASVTSLVLVFIGGGLGSVLRYLAGIQAARSLGAFTSAEGWPWATFAVNVIGCCVIGLAFRLLPVPAEGPASARLLLMTGVLGGFTTFSAFSLEAAQLWMRGDAQGAALYVAASLVFCLVGVALGLAIGKSIVA